MGLGGFDVGELDDFLVDAGGVESGSFLSRNTISMRIGILEFVRHTGLMTMQSTSAPCAWNECSCVHVFESQNFT